MVNKDNPLSGGNEENGAEYDEYVNHMLKTGGRERRPVALILRQKILTLACARNDWCMQIRRREK